MTEPLGYAALWSLLHEGKAISAARDGQHLFSFQMRKLRYPEPTVIKVLFGPKYELAGWLETGSQWLTMHDRELEPFIKQGADYHPTVKKVHRIFNQFLFKNRAPEGIDLVPAVEFEVARCRGFMAGDPDVYQHLSQSDTKLAADCLQRIRNCGSISDGQRRLVLKEMEGAAWKRQHSTPSLRRQARARQEAQNEDAIDENEMTEAAKKRARERAEEQRKIVQMRDEINDDPA